MKKTNLIALFLLITLLSYSQKGKIQGRVYNEKNNEPLEFATIRIEGTLVGSTTDPGGNFLFTGIDPGFVRLIVSYVGFETTTSAEIQVQGNQTTFIDLAVPESSSLINEVVIRPHVNLKKIESPVSFATVGVKEIEKAAGVNRDVSKVLQTLPGVGATDPNR
ncbi:MAG: carboxypeptidase-like regulatory domain-containing protein, partial [Proteiniphilum sp.]